ncbi:SGS-domain-containing protein [Testicularia cyperi]|uniref:SGS-domain-containing protein n=1 Tax=Testicularia cyperi TaxID=1882483 RepID=A0A317XUB6_9BASI|nr:SGS-domain-containing protein [Testicularia cyperi]
MSSAGPSTAAAAAAAAAKPRFDFYQTETAVNVSVFIKGVRQADLAVDISDHSLFVKAHSEATGSEHILQLDPLFSTVDPSSSSFKVLSTKIDIVLHKAHPGQRWPKLEASPDSVTSATTPSYTAATSPQQPTGPTARARSKWDSFDPDEDDEDGSGAAGGSNAADADINKFFQRIYADADEDTRRAMMKSYTESGGTSLSTDWSKVGKATVETKPPEGLEARKWES